jgi:glucose 1-dehydrogenase
MHCNAALTERRVRLKGMRPITVEPKKPDSAKWEEVEEPDVRQGSVLVETIAVGVCGTDVEIVQGKYGWPPRKPRLIPETLLP